MSDGIPWDHAKIWLLVVAWLGAIAIAVIGHKSLLPSLPTILVALATVVYFRNQYVSLPKKNVEDIAEITEDIEESIVNNDLQTIPAELVKTEELQTLVNALNRLIAFQQDRYAREREFTANASHELRTPLAGIRLQAQLALMANDSEQRNKALNNVLKAVDRGTRLVEQLLVLSRLAAERIELEQESFHLPDLFRSARDELEELASAKGIRIVIDDASPEGLTAHRDSVEILLNNLLRNSIIYSPSGSEVDISARKLEDGVKIIVKDNGPGIPPQLYASVMERFKKAVDGSKTGTGLGLAIVKRITDLHDGDIRLLAGDDGTGLTVEVSLPQ